MRRALRRALAAGFALVLLSSISAKAAEPEDELRRALAAGAEDAVLAPLYQQAGDALLRRNQIDRAADAFEQALKRGASQFPPSERRRLAQHLAWAGRLDTAIDALRGILEEDPANLEARIDLARFLSWRGLLVEAGAQADEALRRDPGNRAAREVKANAASWRGDSGTAQPLYRELLAEREQFDLRLNYTHDLLTAGRVVEARRSRAEMDAADDRQRGKIAALDTRIDRFAPPRVLAGLTRYDDSDDNTRDEYKLGGGITLGNIGISAEAERVDTEDRVRSAEVQRLRGAAAWPAGDSLRLRAGAGVARIEDGTGDDYFIGYVGADGTLGRLRFSAELAHDVLDDTALIVSNRIRRTEADLLTSFSFTDRWRMDGDLELYDFSDDNAGWKLEVTPQYVLRVGNPGLRLGYRRVQSAFDRQSGGGYFDPSALYANQLVLIGTLFGERLRGDIELYGGQQVTRRSGQRQRDEILGGSARLAYDFNRHFSLESEIEGGNFSLLSSGGFDYILWSVNLVVFF
jgi:tetratricopeptide (TPR) repeat protein